MSLHELLIDIPVDVKNNIDPVVLVTANIIYLTRYIGGGMFEIWSNGV
jgi:hypothetical protein